MTTTAPQPLASSRLEDRYASVTLAVEALARSNVAEDEFFRKLIDLLVQTLGARAGVVWLLDPHGMLSMFCDVRFAELGMGANAVSDRQNVQRLIDVVQRNQTSVFAWETTALNEVRQPAQALVVPIPYKQRAIGAVQIFLDASHPPDELLDDTQFVEEMCSYASRYLSGREEAGSATYHLEFWNRLEAFLLRLQRSLDPVEVAAVAVNDGRPLLGCDRLSIAWQNGPKTVLFAISGQDRVNRRSNVVRLLEKAAGAVIASRKPITFDGRSDQLPPFLERALIDYCAEGGSRLVRIIPLFPPDPLIASTPDSETRADRKPAQRPAFAAIIFEQLDDAWLKPVVAERTEVVAEHVAAALWNADSHSRLFLLPLWRSLGRFFRWFRGRNLAKTMAAIAVMAGAVGGLALVPAEYRVEGVGKLMPVVQRQAFAPWEGEVVELFVRSGQRVHQGEPLLRLRNDELSTELLAARGKFDEKRQLAGSLQAEIDDANRRSARDEEIRLRGRLAQTRIEIKSAQERFESLQEQFDSLTICSPIDGTVATFQIEQRLMNRPVQRGEVLLEVMDEAGEWQLELQVPEVRMGHLLLARQRAKGPLLVDFVLATTPERSYVGALQEVATRTGIAAEGGPAVEVNVSIERDLIPQCRIGAEVRGKVHCGQRSLGYVLFGDVVEFVQRHVW